MTYRQYRPPAKLRSIVECWWTLESREPGGDVQRVVPDGRPECILHLGDPFEVWQGSAWQKQPKFCFAGQLTGPLQVRPTGATRTLGIRFRPHVPGLLFSKESEHLTDRVVGIEDIDPKLNSVPALLHRVLEADSKSDARIAGAADHAIRRAGNVGVVELARMLALSTRQFERRFSREVGIGPKLFCRIQRLQNVIARLEDPGASWVDAALAAGYCDQSHLIRDFHDLAGDAPSALLQESSDLARHFLR